MIHKARWVSEAEFRFGVSASGLRGGKCVLQPPNIFPERLDEASDQGRTSVSLTAPYLSPCQNLTMPRETHTDPQRKKKKEKKKVKGHHKMSVEGGKKRLLQFSTELGNP